MPPSDNLNPVAIPAPAAVCAPVDGAFEADPRTTAKIAIVDDEPINVKVVRKHLQNAGYRNFITSSDAASAFSLISREQPDVVLLDVMMPQVNGIEILRAIRSAPRLRHIPVLILTASTDSETKLKALDAGATDFLAKPVDPSDLAPRIKNALIVKAHHDHLCRYSEKLEQQVRARTAELELSHLQVILCLARAAEYRDDTTGRHVIRVGRYVGILANELGYNEHDATLLGLAAQLHDVGKIGLPDGILLKPGRLTKDEFEVVKRHCEIGDRIVQPVDDEDLKEIKIVYQEQVSAQSPLLQMAGRIARSHHEWWDGNGYPRKLAKEAIPLEGRITSVADVFDALTSERPYKAAYSPTKALEIMEKNRGTQFDPAILDALLRRLDDILKVYKEQADSSILSAA